MLIVFMFRQNCHWQKNKAFFLTMKIDNDLLLFLHDASSVSDKAFLLLYDMNKSNLKIRPWQLRKWRICFGILIWKERCLYFGWNVRYSRVNYLLQWNQGWRNWVSLYILKKICLSMQVFRHDQSTRKTCARTLSS